jgi:RNA polymerase sigma factor (sigma-70 family)
LTEAVLALPAAPRGAHDMRGDAADTSDRSLLARVANGDEAALGELYDRFGRVAYGLALRVLRDERLAEDAVQEAFLAIWRQAASFQPDRAAAQTWVLTLVHRRAVDLVRREERRRADPLAPTAEVPGGASAAEDADLRRRREAVQQALEQLPEEQRRPIELAYYGGLSQSELAEQLGEPLGTIKSRMFAGLKRLRELLGTEF